MSTYCRITNLLEKDVESVHARDECREHGMLRKGLANSDKYFVNENLIFKLFLL